MSRLIIVSNRVQAPGSAPAGSQGGLAVALAAVNVFGGFLVTRRMLEMFKKKERKVPAKDAATGEVAK